MIPCYSCHKFSNVLHYEDNPEELYNAGIFPHLCTHCGYLQPPIKPVNKEIGISLKIRSRN